MIENGVSLMLDQPREQVFDFLVDFTNEPAGYVRQGLDTADLTS